MLIDINNWNVGTIERCYLYNCSSGNPSAYHPDVLYVYPGTGLTFRYNVVSNGFSEELFFSYGGSTATYIYGNVFIQPGGVGNSSGPNVIQTSPDFSNFGDFHIFNNVFYGLMSAAIQLEGGSTGTSEVYNNIFFGPTWNPGSWNVNSGYNGYNGSVRSGEANSISSSVNPWVNSAAGDYHSKTGSWPIGKGKSLTVDGYINMDMDGNIRGPSVTAWDIGAYQYGTGTTNPLIQASPGIVAFGQVAANTTVTNSFTIKNVGAGTLAGTATVPGPTFTIVAGSSYSLVVGQSQIVAVAYRPSTASDTQTVTFTGGGGATASVNGSLRAAQTPAAPQNFHLVSVSGP
jgi:hypothetical protein